MTLHAWPPAIPRAQRAPIHQEAIDELSVRYLRWFVIEGWEVLHPGRPLKWSWHHDLICDKLEAVSRGEIPELVICIPPRCLKSELVSVFWHAWRWLDNPGEQRVTIANEDSLAERDSRNTRILLKSGWYKRLQEHAASLRRDRIIQRLEAAGQPTDDVALDPIWAFAEDQDQKRNFANDRGGLRVCLSVNAKVTGKGADVLIIDDPYDAKEATKGSPEQVAVRMRSIVDDYRDVWRSRLNDPKTGARVIIMQRLHLDDLAGDRIRAGAECVVLPMEYDPTSRHVHPDDPRTTRGELLHPDRFDRAYVDSLKADPAGRETWNAQYQQDPLPASGNAYRIEFLQRADRRYRGRPEEIAQHLAQVAIFIDANVLETRTGSFFCATVLGRRPPDHVFWLGEYRARVDHWQAKQGLRALCHRFPGAYDKIIEDKANGPAVASDLEHELPGIALFKRGRLSKEAFAQIHGVPPVASGKLWLPDPEVAPEILDWIDEVARFPAEPNDRADTLAMGFAWFAEHPLMIDVVASQERAIQDLRQRARW